MDAGPTTSAESYSALRTDLMLATGYWPGNPAKPFVARGTAPVEQ